MRRFVPRSRRTFRSGRAKREHVWVRAAGRQILTQGGTVFDEFGLVTAADWIRGTAGDLQKGATIVRIVGDVFFQTDPSAVANVRNFARAQCYFGLLKRDKDDTSVLDLAAGALGEDWMHLHSNQVFQFYDPTPTLTGYGLQVQGQTHIDVKVKRKLTSDDVIKVCMLTVREALETDVNAYIMLSALIQLP